MGTLRLVTPISTAQAKKNARTTDDEYGFRARFRTKSVNELIASFNSDVGCQAWVHARGVFLCALRDALLASDLDCSRFISDKRAACKTPEPGECRTDVRCLGYTSAFWS